MTCSLLGFGLHEPSPRPLPRKGLQNSAEERGQAMWLLFLDSEPERKINSCLMALHITRLWRVSCRIGQRTVETHQLNWLVYWKSCTPGSRVLLIPPNSYDSRACSGPLQTKPPTPNLTLDIPIPSYTLYACTDSLFGWEPAGSWCSTIHRKKGTS